MKCKRIFKVVSALALTVALMVSTGVVSFAASYTTTTTYKSTDTIEVTSVATYLANGDMATYVAYNNDEFSEANAVYIDQATANGTDDVTFTYQTSSDNVKATVKFGGSTETSAQDATIEGYTVTVTVDNGEAYTVTVPEVDMTTDDGDAAYDSEYLAREIPVTVTTGYAVSSVKVNNEEVEVWYVKDGCVVIYSNVITADATVAITTKAVETPSIAIGTVNAEVEKITAFAKAICGDDVEYGIYVSAGTISADSTVAYDANTLDLATQTVKLPALGKGSEGGFCVEYQAEEITAGTYNVAAYAGTATASTTVEVEAAE